MLQNLRPVGGEVAFCVESTDYPSWVSAVIHSKRNHDDESGYDLAAEQKNELVGEMFCQNKSSKSGDILLNICNSASINVQADTFF